MNNQNKSQPFELYQRVCKTVQEGRYPEALELSDQLLKDNKKNAFLICVKGHILHELNRRTEAREFFKFALELIKSGQASDFMVESDRLLARMIIDKLVKLQDFLIRTELLCSKTENGSPYKIQLDKARTTQLVLARKLFDYLIPDDYKTLSEISKTQNVEFNSLITEAMERIRKLEGGSHPIYKTEKIEKTQAKLKKVEKIMIALQNEINSAQKGILSMRVSELNALLEVK